MKNIISDSDVLRLFKLNNPSEKLIFDKDLPIYLGDSVTYGLPVFLNFNKLINHHLVAIGMTGSGKSNMIKFLISKILSYSDDSSVLVFDWSGEYRGINEFLGGSEANFVTKGLNFDKKHLNDLKISKDLLKKYKILDTDSGLSLDEIFDYLTVFDFSRIEEKDRVGISSIILFLIKERIYEMGISNRKRIYIVMDEAWKFIQNSSIIMDLVREGRKYGVGLIIATQLSSDINNEIIANSATIFIFRLHNDDFNFMKKLNIIYDDKFDLVLHNLSVGECLVNFTFSDKNSRNIIIKKIFYMDLSELVIKMGKSEFKISKSKLNEIVDQCTDNPQPIISFVGKYDKVNLRDFVSFMVDSGLKRAVIVSILRKIGVDDITIVRSFD